MKKVINYTIEEQDYIENNHTNEIANIFYKQNPSRSRFTVYAKPFDASKSSFKFSQSSETNAYKLASALMDESIGYSFEVRGKRVLAKPTTNKATLVFALDDENTAREIVKFLRKQEISNRKTAEKRKAKMQGTQLIRKMITLSEDELYESLYDAMEDELETEGIVCVDNTPYTDLISAKTHIAQADFNKKVANASQELCEKLNEFHK